MALNGRPTNMEFYIDDEVREGSYAPPTSDAVAKAIGSASETVDAHVFEKILMRANDKTYEVTIDADGALAVSEVTG